MDYFATGLVRSFFYANLSPLSYEVKVVEEALSFLEVEGAFYFVL